TVWKQERSFDSRWSSKNELKYKEPSTKNQAPRTELRKDSPPMKLRSRSIYPFVWLFALVCALSIGMAASHAQNPTPSPTPAASPAASASPTPSPSPTPTPVNWSTDPMLKRFVFRG